MKKLAREVTYYSFDDVSAVLVAVFFTLWLFVTWDALRRGDYSIGFWSWILLMLCLSCIRIKKVTFT